MISMRIVEYRGWKEAVELRNEEARVVVVPEVGRILFYGLTDDTNVLYEDRALAGRTLPAPGQFYAEQGAPVWLNFGGDKVWPTEQSRWPETNGVGWPPDPWFDGGAQACRLLADGVEMTSGISLFNGARITRTLRLAATGSSLSIEQRIEKVQTGQHAMAEPIPFTIWSVTQIRPPEQVLLPLRAGSRFSDRWHDYALDNRSCTRHVEVSGDIAVLSPALPGPQKIGVDAGPWLAGIVDGYMMVERFRFDPAAAYPDGGLSATVFTCPDYTELELMSPFAALQIGQALEFPITWELHRLPAACQTAKDRRMAALDILNAAGSR